MNLRILLVEDEEHLRDTIKFNLELEGYLVTTASNGKQAIQKFKQERFNLIILDVMMPELNGFEVCEIIRLEDSLIPILFLTAKSATEDRVMGLKKGGDDYLSKPFNLEEMLLRVANLIKRGMPLIEKSHLLNSFRIGDKEVDFSTYEIKEDEKTVQVLTRKETMLLKLLVERKGEVISRNDILKSVWNYDVMPSTRTIDNFILNFRKYFEPDPKSPIYFHSIRGVGYKFTDIK